MTTPATWVFGYGSLVSPASLHTTLGRDVPAAHRRVAHLRGFARRWNYGSQRLRGDWCHDGRVVERGVVISLGLVEADEECNGVVFRVDADELARLDHRESDYQRTEVGARLRVEGDPIEGPVVTYVPRPSAIARYEEARRAGLAAVRRDYWRLVHHAFADLGDRHLRAMHRTPRPDVPIADVRLRR